MRCVVGQGAPFARPLFGRRGGCPTILPPWLRYFARALFCRPLKDCAISSAVERLLHTQEVAGSNPASRMFSRLCRNLKREFGVERSPRRQVAGSNPASRMFSRLSRNLKRELGVERSPRRQVAGSNPASRMFSRLSRNLKRELEVEWSPRRQVAGSNAASRTICQFWIFFDRCGL